MTQLGNRAALAKAGVAAATAAKESGLAKWRSTNQRGAVAVMPMIGTVWIELPGDAEVTRIEADVFREMEAFGLAPVAINMLTYDACRTRHTLAWAVREQADHSVAFGTLEEWGAHIDVDLLNACGIVYSTVREELDPIGMPTLTPEDCNSIREAIEKKSPTLLRSYGIAKLSLYLLSTESQRSTSPSAT